MKRSGIRPRSPRRPVVGRAPDDKPAETLTDTGNVCPRRGICKVSGSVLTGRHLSPRTGQSSLADTIPYDAYAAKAFVV